ncbi:MAG: DeoR family transcriptional regulator [Deltaproteobacteria bacterium]|nr:DeoR family transcriptional regulator [Deltaproteobacteria bacterium]
MGQGLDVPRFALVEDEFTVTLPGRRSAAVERPEGAPRHQDPLQREPVTDRQKQILRQVLEADFVTSAACVQALGIAKDTAWRDLNDLIAQGYVRVTGAGRASRYVAEPRLQAILSSDGQTQSGRKSDESPTHPTQGGRKPSTSRVTGATSGGNEEV